MVEFFKSIAKNFARFGRMLVVAGPPLALFLCVFVLFVGLSLTFGTPYLASNIAYLLILLSVASGLSALGITLCMFAKNVGNNFANFGRILVIVGLPVVVFFSVWSLSSALVFGISKNSSVAVDSMAVVGSFFVSVASGLSALGITLGLFAKNVANNFAKFGRMLVVAGLVLAVFSIFWFLVAALGTKFGIWDYGFGLMTMTFSWGLILVAVTFGLCTLGILLSLFAAPRTRPAILGLVGILISSLIMGRLSGVGQEATRLPPIHDIQTDWGEPIAFSEELMKIRGDSNPVVNAPVIDDIANGRWPGYGGRLVSEVQEEAEWQPPLTAYNCLDCRLIDYAELKEEYARKNSKELKNAPYPYILDSKYYRKSLDDVFDSVEFVVKSRGWEIVKNDKKAGIIEATDSTSWFGFEDDVAIRVRLSPWSIRPPHYIGSEPFETLLPKGEFVPVKVDVRSVSRVGLSDIGTNAKRVNKFLIDLDRAVHRKR